MEKIIFDSEYFNPLDTLECGQIFRFSALKSGYKVISLDKCAYVYQENDNAVVECEKEDRDYFYNYFDLGKDYSKIYNSAINENIPILTKSANLGKGVRILNQDSTEMLFSFIVSQNNNIPRIKSIIERLCFSLGEKKTFMGETFYAFPLIERLAEKDENFFKSIGLGYRASYIEKLAKSIINGFNVESLKSLPLEDLKKSLLNIYGVGPKVADCVMLFGFNRSDSFPVDTWIEKLYKEDFNGKLTDRNKISKYFTDRFKVNSGYYQQYLFYYKRSLEKK